MKEKMLRGTRDGVGLSHREIGFILGLDHRHVYMIEKRALAKMSRHPEMREAFNDILLANQEVAARKVWPEVQAHCALE